MPDRLFWYQIVRVNKFDYSLPPQRRPEKICTRLALILMTNHETNKQSKSNPFQYSSWVLRLFFVVLGWNWLGDLMFLFWLLIHYNLCVINKTRTYLPILTSHPNAPCGFYAKVCISTANTLLKEGRLQHRIRKLRVTDILFLWLGTFFFHF